MALTQHYTTLTLPDFLSRVHKHVLGGDILLNQLESLSVDSSSFPPYNVEKVSDTEYRLTLAIAGFTREEVQISVVDRNLSVSGTKNVNVADNRIFIHRGIAERNFRRDFQLAEYVIVADAELKDGLLVINLVREIPEARKARVIELK